MNLWMINTALRLPAYALWENQFCISSSNSNSSSSSSSSIVLLRGSVIRVFNFCLIYLLSMLRGSVKIVYLLFKLPAFYVSLLQLPAFFVMQCSSGLLHFYHPHAIYWHIETGDEIEQNY